VVAAIPPILNQRDVWVKKMNWRATIACLAVMIALFGTFAFLAIKGPETIMLMLNGSG
jgi:hypothetical protein